MPVPPALLHRWCHILTRLLQTSRVGPAPLSRPTCRAVAHLAIACLLAPSCRLADLAAALPGPASPASRSRRLQRHLASDRLDPAALQAALLPALLASPQLPHHLTLVYDPTTHTDRAHVLVLGVLHRARVLPLAWRALPTHTRWPASRDALRTALLDRVAAALPTDPGRRVTLVVDRGEPDAALLASCRRHGWHLLARLSASAAEPTVVELSPGPDAGGAGGQQRLWELVGRVAPGGAGMRRPWTGQARVWLRRGGPVVQLTVWWPAGQREPWVLASTEVLPGRVVVRRYAQRMRVEASFAEWKGRGWQLERSRLGGVGAAGRAMAPARLERLLVGVVLAQWWRTQLGARLVRAGGRRRVDGHRHRAVSLLRLGWADVCERLADQRPVPLPIRWRDELPVFTWYP